MEFATVVTKSPSSKRPKKTTLSDAQAVGGGEAAGWSSLTNSSLTSTSTGYLDFVNGHRLGQASSSSSSSSAVMDASTSSSFVGGMMLCGDINTLDGIGGMSLPFMGTPLVPAIPSMDVGKGQGLVAEKSGTNKKRPRPSTTSSTSTTATGDHLLTGDDCTHADVNATTTTASSSSSLSAVNGANDKQPVMGNDAANGSAWLGCGCVQEWCMCGNGGIVVANGVSTSFLSALASNGHSTAAAGFHHASPHAYADNATSHTNGGTRGDNGDASVGGVDVSLNPFASWLSGHTDGFPLNHSYGNMDGGFGSLGGMSHAYHGHGHGQPMSSHPSMLLGGGPAETSHFMSTQPLNSNSSLLMSMFPSVQLPSPLGTGSLSAEGGGGLLPSESTMSLESMQNVQALVQQVGGQFNVTSIATMQLSCNLLIIIYSCSFASFSSHKLCSWPSVVKLCINNN